MQMERDAANELTQMAQEGYNTVRQQYDAKREEAEPHRARRRELREAVNSLQVGRSMHGPGIVCHLRIWTWGTCAQHALAESAWPQDKAQGPVCSSTLRAHDRRQHSTNSAQHATRDAHAGHSLLPPGQEAERW